MNQKIRHPLFLHSEDSHFGSSFVISARLFVGIGVPFHGLLVAENRARAGAAPSQFV